MILTLIDYKCMTCILVVIILTGLQAQHANLVTPITLNKQPNFIYWYFFRQIKSVKDNPNSQGRRLAAILQILEKVIFKQLYSLF